MLGLTHFTIMSKPIVISDSFMEWATVVTLIAAFVTFYRHIECHKTGCHRLGKFTHGHYKLCHIHHPLVNSSGKVTQEDINKLTKKPSRSRTYSQ